MKIMIEDVIIYRPEKPDIDGLLIFVLQF